jgi:hypothetical protein
MIVAASSPAHHFFVIFGAALTGFGLIFVLVGAVIRRTQHGFRGAARTQGTIVDFDPRTPGMAGNLGAPHGIVYMPTVEFTTADGTPVRATSNIGTNPRPGRVGDSVTVLYDPRNPQRVRVESGKAVFSCLEVAFWLVGGAVAALGIVILIAAH